LSTAPSSYLIGHGFEIQLQDRPFLFKDLVVSLCTSEDVPATYQKFHTFSSLLNNNCIVKIYTENMDY